MPQRALFPRWTNLGFRLALAISVLALPILLVGLLLYVRSPWNTSQWMPVEQPVQFDHRHHVVDDQIDCLYCHRGAETTRHAGVPSTDVCMGCHAQVWNDSPLLEPVRRSYFANVPIAWNRVHDLPDFVYFDHAVHVRRGVPCATCHGQVREMARVYQVAPLTMGWCLDCHRRAETGSASAFAPHPVGRLTTCSACHR